MTNRDDFYPGIYTMTHGTTRKTKRADKKRVVILFFCAYKIRQPHDDAKFQMRFLGRDIDTHMHPSGFLQHLCQPKKKKIQLMGRIYHSHSKTLLC